MHAKVNLKNANMNIAEQLVEKGLASVHQENVEFIFDVFVLQKASLKSLSLKILSFMVFVFANTIFGFGQAYLALRVGLRHLSLSLGIFVHLSQSKIHQEKGKFYIKSP